MSDRQIRSRLDKLFDSITQEPTTGEERAEIGQQLGHSPRRASPPPATAAPNARSASLASSTTTETVVASGYGDSPSTLALDFRGADQDWSRLQIVDENPGRTWTENDQLLVQQVVDQLTLALQNANLFQQTQRQTEELAVLNEMGREIATLYSVEKIAETIYRYTSQLMDTRNFFVALTDLVRDEISFPVLYDEGERLPVTARKVGRGLTDWVIRNKKPLLLNGDVTSQMLALGLELMTIGNAAPTQSWLGVPLLIGTRVLGALVVQSTTTANLYQERQRDLLLAIAGQSAIALQNAILFQQTEQQNRELVVLNELGRELSALLNVEGVVHTAYGYTARLMAAEHFFLGLYDADTEQLTFPLAVSHGNEIAREPELLTNGLIGYVVRTRNPVLITDDLPGYLAQLGIGQAQAGEEKPAESWLGVPLVLGQEVLGALVVQSSETPYLYSERQRDLLAAIASQTAIALQNARLYQEEQYRRRVAGTLSDMARIAGSTLELSEVVRLLLQQMPRLVSFHTASIQLIEMDGRRRQIGRISLEQNRQQEMEAASGPDLGPVEEDALLSEIVHSRELIAIPDTHSDPRWDGRPESEVIHSWLGAPLLVGRDVIGFLILDDTRPQAYTSATADVVKSFAAQAAVAIQNARLFEDTEAKEENYRNLVENAPEAIVVVDAESLRFLEPNENAQRLYGLSHEEMLLATPAQMAPERQPGGGLSEDVAREKLGLALEGDVVSFEWELKNREGAIIPTEVRLARLPGQGQRVRATFTDITARKAAEAALRRQNEYLSTAAEVGRLVTSTLDLSALFSRTVDLVRASFSFYHAAIFTLDEGGLNAVLREATGTAGEEMKRRGHALPVGSRSIIGQVTATGSTTVVNDTTADSVFKPNPLLPDTRAEAGLPLRIGPRIIGALDIQATEVGAFKAEDIAVLEILADQVAVAIENARSYDLSQKAVEELRALDQIKSQFLANMSHELRTPLNSIIGFSRVILKGIDGPISEQQQQDLSAIYNSGQHLLGLINDILDLAKIEAGKMELSLEEVSAADTIHGVMSTAVGLVKDKPIRLKAEIPPDLPSIRADPMRLRQILINLLSNASKFTEEGEIIVRAEVENRPTGTDEVRISVIDSGPGIAPEDQEKLFRAFSQVDSSPTRKTGGTGLGLSICQHLVGLHHGRIGVQSAVGRGSTFYFTVPVFQREAELVVGDGRDVVLCIDDDSQVIKLYERYLTPEGYRVESLTTPGQACQIAKKLRPFAITLDIMMPGYDGWQVLVDLKRDPETRDIPIIICSIVEEEEKGFSLGAADYLLKPILENDLIQSLRRLNGDGSISEVLVIDDDEHDRRLIEKVLSERSTFRPIIARGGQEGWDMLLAHRPQAIILDLFMPDLDGFAILERLRTTASLRDLPVVVISGVDLTAEQKDQLDDLGKHMLQKGLLEDDELFSTLEHALRRLESN